MIRFLQDFRVIINLGLELCITVEGLSSDMIPQDFLMHKAQTIG